MSTIDITPARERAGLTKSELARRLGVPASTIRRIENRPGYDPRFSTAHEIAVALGCRLDELVREHQDEPTQNK